MKNILYVIAAILVIAWLIGVVGFQAGGLIHILLALAFFVILVRVIQGRRIL